jgi:hypothetical protein
MQRFIAIFLLFMYSLSVSGSVVQLHFCKNNIEAITFSAEDYNKCCCVPKDRESNNTSISELNISTAKSCCSDTKIQLAIGLDQSVAQSNWEVLKVLQAQMPDAAVFYTNAPAPTTLFFDKSFPANAPPLGIWQGIPLYKLYSSLVYYG